MRCRKYRGFCPAVGGTCTIDIDRIQCTPWQTGVYCTGVHWATQNAIMVRIRHFRFNRMPDYGWEKYERLNRIGYSNKKLGRISFPIKFIPINSARGNISTYTLTHTHVQEKRKENKRTNRLPVRDTTSSGRWFIDLTMRRAVIFLL